MRRLFMLLGLRVLLRGRRGVWLSWRMGLGFGARLRFRTSLALRTCGWLRPWRRRRCRMTLRAGRRLGGMLLRSGRVGRASRLGSGTRLLGGPLRLWVVLLRCRSVDRVLGLRGGMVDGAGTGLVGRRPLGLSRPGVVLDRLRPRTILQARLRLVGRPRVIDGGRCA